MSLNRSLSIALIFMAVIAGPALAQDEGWPRTVMLDEGRVTVYAPQLEAMNDGVLYYRAALAYRPGADSEPIFGAGWLKSDVDIDEDENRVSPRNLSLTQTRFPDGTTDIEAELATALTRQSSRWNLDFTVTELNAALDAAQAETLSAQKLKNTPPLIIYKDRPSVLVIIDGDPVLRDIEDSPYQAVINTPFPLITDGKSFYLNAAENAWYRASAATGPYDFESSPPRDMVAMVESGRDKASSENAEEPSNSIVTRDNAPEIVVSTVPAELLVTDGPADFVPLVDDLLVLKNSADDVFLHLEEQKYYIVLAGRWYQSSSLDGPWSNQSADELPVAFSRIPTDSAQADSRVYVAGTPEAEDAVLDAQVPQTAAVKRGQVDIEVEYDGQPDFEPVEGTEDLYYAENTGATVLESDRSYYLLEDGVWYVSDSPHGPWVVSDHRPGELESVEPSSPVYNTKYVHVYDATPEVVYVGYTPGYVGSYVYGSTLVYGTGYHYRPWISHRYYYPRVRTWGWSVGYSSYGGWSFGIGWNHGGWNLGYYSGGYWHYNRPWYNRYYGYWGPRGYAPAPYYVNNYYIYNNYSHGPYGKRYGYRKGYRHGYRDGHRDGGDYAYHDDYGHGDRRNRDRGDGYRDGRGAYDENRNGRQRNRNLYRDSAQQAQVVQTRDTWMGRPNTASSPAPGQFERSERRHVDNQKIRQNRTGPVSRTDIRDKAMARDARLTASRETAVAGPAREVKRAEFGASNQNRNQPRVVQQSSRQNKVRQNRTEPISRNELSHRADMVASRSNRSNTSARLQSREQPVNQAQKRANRQTVTSPSRKVSTRVVKNSQSQPVVSAPREVERRSMSPGSSRQVVSKQRQASTTQPSSQPRVVNRSADRRTTPSRELRAQPRSRTRQANVRPRSVEPVTQINRTPARPPTQARQRTQRQAVAQTRPQVRSAPSRKVQAPRTQPSRPQVRQAQPQKRSAPAPRPQRQAAPRPQQRAAPRPQQRAAPTPRSNPAAKPRKAQPRETGPQNKRRRQ